MKKLLLCLFCFTLPAVLLCAQPATTSYIKKHKKLADSLSAAYGIPTSVILGIAVVESSSGTSRITRLMNNHFGMAGKNNIKKTHNIKSKYKQYGDAKASYRDFCLMLLRRNFFGSLRGKKDYTLWLKALSKTGYSGHPAEWIKRVSGVIIKHKL